LVAAIFSANAFPSNANGLGSAVFMALTRLG
jgi:hypothetical protein